jgi:hypothetical protein
MKKSYIFHNDPGHGWLEVPLADLQALRIEKRISKYSYFSAAKNHAFLEEDVDASYFMYVAEKAGWNVVFVDKYTNRFNCNMASYTLGTEYNYEAQSKEMYG